MLKGTWAEKPSYKKPTGCHWQGWESVATTVKSWWFPGTDRAEGGTSGMGVGSCVLRVFQILRGFLRQKFLLSDGQRGGPARPRGEKNKWILRLSFFIKSKNTSPHCLAGSGGSREALASDVALYTVP